MKLYAELRLYDTHKLSEQLRRKAPPIFLAKDGYLVYLGHIKSETLSEWLKQMWPFVNHQRDWIKTAIQAGAYGEIYCYVKNLEEEITLSPEALTICTSLGLPLRISKRLPERARKQRHPSDRVHQAIGSGR
jgi:hypothetical protein